MFFAISYRISGDLIMTTLYVMCGVPGAGKSTFSRKFAEEKGLERFSFDEMRCFRLESFMKPALEAMRNGKSVILDTVNLRVNVRKKVLQAAEEIPCKKVVVFMDTSLEQCLYRNAHRECRLQDCIIESTYRSLQKPTLDEGWDEIIIVKEDGSYETDFAGDKESVQEAVD